MAVTDMYRMASYWMCLKCGAQTIDHGAGEHHPCPDCDGTMISAAAPILRSSPMAPPAQFVGEQGPGIATLALKAPPRPRPGRHETKSWGPFDSWESLPDAERGRYGWVS